MIDWMDVVGSSRVCAVAYDPEQEIIYVRFTKDAVEWWYGNCPPVVWEEFMMPGTSKGQYIHRHLDHHPNGRLV